MKKNNLQKLTKAFKDEITLIFNDYSILVITL